MSYNNHNNRNHNNRNVGGGNWKPQNNYNNMGSVNPWDSGSGLNAGANVLNSLVGNAPDPVQQLLAASKLLSNVLGPQQSLLQTPQVPSLLGQGGYVNRGNVGNFDRFRNAVGVGGRDQNNWGQNRRNDSGNNYRNNNRGGNQQRNKLNQNSSNTASQIKEQNKIVNKKQDESAAVKDDATSGDKDDTKPKEENRYAAIPKALLYCHVCRKYMWDDVSFDNHIKGRNHKSMLEELDKLYKMQCEIMRQEFRMNEQQHGWYYDKAQRMGKKVKKPLEYCTMCDLSYHGTRGFHRKSTKHQELKHFLHPKCNICNLEFPTRLEWDEHVLLPAHLKKMASRRSELKPDSKDDDFDFDDFLYVCDLSNYLASDLKAASSVLTDVTPVIAEKDEKEEEEEKEEVEDDKEGGDKEKKEKKEKIDESTIVFHGDKDDNVETFLQEIRNLTEEEYSKKIFVRYNASIPAGTEFVVQSAGHLCRICNLFVGERDDALKHCKSYSHHISLVNLLAKARKTVKKRSFKDEKEEDKMLRKRSYKDGKEEEEEEEDVEMKETADVEEGNWKRRKVIKEDGKGKKMGVDDDDEEDEDEEDVRNGDVTPVKTNAVKEEEKPEETKEEEEVSEVKQQEPATPRSTQRARRGRKIK